MPSPRLVELPVVALLLCTLSASALAVRPGPIERVYVPLSQLGDTLAKKQSHALAYAWADSVQSNAERRGDRMTAIAARLWRAQRVAAWDADVTRGLPMLDSVLVDVQPTRDTFALATIDYSRAHSEQVAGRTDAALADYQRVLRYARRTSLPVLEGRTHNSLGILAKLRGQYEVARRELEAALRLLPVESFDHLYAQLVVGEMLNRTGHPDEARDHFAAVLAEARRRSNRWTIAAAMQDLGNVAWEQGDMKEADDWFVQAAAHQDTLVARKAVDASSAISCRLNRARVMIALGQLGAAQALLDQQLAASEQLTNPATRYATLGELGELYHRAGRSELAERTLRATRAACAADDAELDEASAIELAGLLREAGRPAEAIALADSLLVPARRARMTAVNAGGALMEKSAALRMLGRTGEALAVAREGERTTRAHGREPSIYWLDAVVELARCQRAAGRPEEAVTTLAGATRAWAAWRAKISDLEWRERAGSGLSCMFAEYGLALLDPRRKVPEAQRAQQAFDALQAFQARTLEERMHGAGLAGRAMAARVSADSLRRAVLRPDECLLDLLVTSDTTFAFVVARGGVTVRTLPGGRRFDALYADWRDAMLAGAATPVVEGGLARLSGELLGPLASSLRASRRIVVTGGGSLALWPWAALTLPGESAPLGAGREIACAPSATLFAALRAQGPSAAPAPRLLALSRTTDVAGRELPGAERELAMLGKDYDRVTVRSNPGDRSLAELTAGLASFDALHFAAHAEAAPGAPWRSGFLLGRGAGDDAYLRASSVARLKLRARLAVLSGCQSAGATALAGEGALGLSAGFLSAGTRTVVATLWPVEDATAALYMDTFYQRLAAGRTVSAAAQEASASLRSAPATANPRSWAAFVVLGEPSTTFPLRRRARA